MRFVPSFKHNATSNVGTEGMHTPRPDIDEIWEVMTQIQYEINNRAGYASAPEIYRQAEFWDTLQEEEDSCGDGECTDFAISSRGKLRAAHPEFRANILLVVCRDKEGHQHGLVNVRTIQGDWILDSRMNKPVPWRSLPYEWLKRESSDTDTWEDLTQRDGINLGF
jgi:predicted transglutaminase-like cysteine proteinase